MKWKNILKTPRGRVALGIGVSLPVAVLLLTVHLAYMGQIERQAAVFRDTLEARDRELAKALGELRNAIESREPDIAGFLGESRRNQPGGHTDATADGSVSASAIADAVLKKLAQAPPSLRRMLGGPGPAPHAGAVADAVVARLEASGVVQAPRSDGSSSSQAEAPALTAEQSAALDQAHQVVDDVLARGSLSENDTLRLRELTTTLGSAAAVEEVMLRIIVAINRDEITVEDDMLNLP